MQTATTAQVAHHVAHKSSGVTTSTFITGSSRTGLALLQTFLEAIEPATLNAISLESTS
jgi:hypothetical protein